MEDGDGGIPCPEDADFMDARPDAAEMEEAIGKFVNGLEQQERSGYHELHSLLSRLPVPVAKVGKTISHAAAMEHHMLQHTCMYHFNLVNTHINILWTCTYNVYDVFL